jgi:hypothetical protein
MHIHNVFFLKLIKYIKEQKLPIEIMIAPKQKNQPYRPARASNQTYYIIQDTTYHIQNIIMTSSQFTGIMSDIIDSNHNGATRSGGRGRDQIKIRVDINGIAGRQLGNLTESFGFEMGAHLRQNFRETQIIL